MIVNRYGITYNDAFQLKKSNIKRIAKQKIHAIDWRCKMIWEIMMCLDGQLNTGLSHEELNDILCEVCTYG